jgi:hypothetical protein
MERGILKQVNAHMLAVRYASKLAHKPGMLSPDPMEDPEMRS